MFYLSFDKDGYFEAVVYSQEEKPGVPGVEALEGLDVPGALLHACKWDGEKLVPDEKRLDELKAKERREQNDAKIEDLKSRLAETDYAVIKIAEGAATREEYADVIIQRQAWRDEINRLEQEVAEA